MRTIDIDSSIVYEALKLKASKNRRNLRAYVNLLLEEHCGLSEPTLEHPQVVRYGGPASGMEDIRAAMARVTGGAVTTGRDLLEQQQGGPAKKTAIELARDREARRGTYDESQDPRDYPKDSDF